MPSKDLNFRPNEDIELGIGETGQSESTGSDRVAERVDLSINETDGNSIPDQGQPAQSIQPQNEAESTTTNTTNEPETRYVNRTVQRRDRSALSERLASSAAKAAASAQDIAGQALANFSALDSAPKETVPPVMNDGGYTPSTSDINLNEFIDANSLEDLSVDQKVKAESSKTTTSPSNVSTASSEEAVAYKEEAKKNPPKEEYVDTLDEFLKPDYLSVRGPNYREVENVFDAPRIPFREEVERTEKEAEDELGQEYSFGNSLGGVIISDPEMSLREVGVGHKILLAALEQPSSYLRKNLSEFIPYTEEDLLRIAQTKIALEVELLMEAINSADIEVYTKKDPVVSDSDQHMRRLVIVYGESIHLHPLAAKLYNADHDGDKMRVDIDPTYNVAVPDAMDRLVSAAGIPMIDDSFFIIYPWSPEETKSQIRGLLEVYGVDVFRHKKLVNDIVKTMDKITNGSKKERTKNWRLFFGYLQKAALSTNFSTSAEVNDRFANLVNSIYAMNNNLWRATMAGDVKSLPNAYTPREKKQIFTSTADYILAEIMDEMVDNPKPFRNYQEAKNYFANSLGLVPGNNLEFRIGAGLAKLLKINENMLIGGEFIVNTDEKFQELLTKTRAFVESTVMSNRVFCGEKQIFAKQYIRDQFLDPENNSPFKDAYKERIIPSMYSKDVRQNSPKTGDSLIKILDVKRFSKSFLERYEFESSILDGADVKIRTDWSTEGAKTVFRGRNGEKKDKEEGRKTGSNSDLARKMLVIYGDCKLGALFGNDAILKQGYIVEVGNGKNLYEHEIGWSLNGKENMTLNEFVRSNQGSINKPKGFKLSNEPRHSYDLLYALADLRRKESGEFGNKLQIGAENAVRRLSEVKEVLKNWDTDKRDYGTFLDFVTENLCLFDKDTFSYFKMYDAHSWINSYWGRRMVNIKIKKDKDGNVTNIKEAADQFLNILNQMSIDYRLSKPREALAAYRAVVEGTAEVKATPESLRARYDNEMSILASSSPFWGVFIRDLNEHGNAFREVKNDINSSKVKKGTERVYNQEKDIWETKEYFYLIGKVGESKKKQKRIDGNWKIIDKYEINSLKELIENENIKWDAKKKIISDVMKMSGASYFMSSEIDYMIRHDPSTIYAGNRFQDLDGYSQAIEDVKAASDNLDRNAKKTWDEIREDLDKAIEDYGEEGFTILLDRIKNNPSSIVNIDTFLYADAITSVWEKAHADSEKSQQQDKINAIVSALNLRESGGLYSDLAVTSDFMTGRIAEDRFINNPVILALVLADPSIKLTVYNEEGEFTVSRKKLCGSNEISDVIQFLKDNPRYAMALRDHNVSAGKEGSCYLTSTSLVDTVAKAKDQKNTGVKDAYHNLIEHPGFGALVVAMEKISGSTAPVARGKIESNTNKLVKDLIKLADYTVDEIRSHVEKLDFGSKPEDPFGEYEPVSDEEFKNKINRMKEHIISYAIELKGINSVTKYNNSTRHQKKQTRKPTFKYFHMDDLNTYSAVEDIEQMFSGGKTAIMTGINGGETKRNGIFAFYASIKTDECETEPISVSADEIRNNFDRYEGWWVETGEGRRRYLKYEYLEETINGQDSLMLYDPATCSDPNCPCKKHSVADASTNNLSVAQFTGMSLMFVMQRMDSTEKNNLKYKKEGIGEDDSITKFSVVDILKGSQALDDFNNRNKSRILKSYRSGGIVEARREYAKILQKNQQELGYDDLNISQYENIAHFVLFEENIGDKARLNILSPSQLSYIANKASDMQRLLACNNVPDLQGIMLEAVSNYKQSKKKLDIVDTLSRIKVSKPSKTTVMTVRKRSSSMERNMKTSIDIFNNLKNTLDENEIKSLVKSKEALRDNAIEVAGRHKELVYEFPYAFEIKKNKEGKKELGKYSPTGYYNLLGVLDGNSTADDLMVHTPQPLNLWIIDGETASEKEINQALNKAKLYGITVAMTKATKDKLGKMKSVKQDILSNIVPAEGREGDTYLIPFFDMELNGADTSYNYDPTQSYNVGVHPFNPGNIVRMFEDPFNQFKQGDSNGTCYQSLIGRSKARKTGTYRMPIQRMCADIIDESDNGTYDSARILSVAEEKSLFVNRNSWEEIENDKRIDISYGVADENKQSNGVKEDLKIAWQKYKRTFQQKKDYDNYFCSNTEPGDIVGWIEVNYQKDGKNAVKYAPIRPYQLAEKKGCPREFDIKYSIDDTTQSIVGEWTHESSLLGHVFKFFEGNNPFNKIMIEGKPAQDQAYLRSGNPLDVCIAAPSTASRRMSNLRMDTMYTLIQEARLEPHGYNLAEHDWAFVDRPDIKASLLDGTARLSDWKKWLSSGPIEFVSASDPDANRLNRFLNHQAKKAISIGVNPSHWFASRFDNPNTGDKQVPSYIAFQYNAMMSQDPMYQNDLQLWLNKMDPTLVPRFNGVNSVDDESVYKNTLFRNDPTTGALQMQCPITTDDGRTFWWWCNVYTSFSFMDQHYSGFEKPSIGGKRYSVPALLTLGYGGRFTTNFQTEQVIRHSLADRSIELANNMSMLLDEDDTDMV